MDIDNTYAFPLTPALSNAEIEANYWKCLYTSSEEKMLQYWVFLPKRVKPAEVVPTYLEEVGMTNLGRYFSNDAQPYMEVWAAYEHIKWEINPADWLFNKLELMGEKVLLQRLIKHPSGFGEFADVLTLKVHSSGDKVISRFTVQKDYNPKKGGGNYFLIKAACAARDYAALADTIYLTVTNWDLLHRSNLGLAELLETFSISNKNSSGFKIPGSWKAKPIAKNRLLIEHTFDDINYGVINLYFYSKDTLFTEQDVFNLATKRFKDPQAGITLITDSLSTIPNDFNPLFGENMSTCQGDILSLEEKIEGFYQCYIFSLGKAWCYAELIGKKRNHRDYHFEANKRCLEIILSTFHIA